jgi:hypothetical protein
MNTLPYRAAFDRIRAEFLDMPGMRLTLEQVERLSGVERAVCKCVLDDLVCAKFLGVLPQGGYGRLADTFKSESEFSNTEWQLAGGDKSGLRVNRNATTGRSDPDRT